MNQHCGKHDKIFSEEHPCPGCETEKNSEAVSTSENAPSAIANPSSADEVIRGHVERFTATLRKALGL